MNLQDHIAKLRAAEASKPAKADSSMIFWGTFADKEYLTYLKPLVGRYTVFLRLDKVTTISQVVLHCNEKKVNKIVSTSIPLLEKLLNWDKRKAPSLADYAGSWFKIPGSDIEVIFISPLKQLVTIPYAKFLVKRFISKFTESEKWYKPTEFSWNLLTPEIEGQEFANFCDCFLISVDIETFKENAAIRCISYTGFYYDPVESGVICSGSVVLPLDSEYNLAVMRKWNWELKAPKVLQKGKYDIAYLSRYSAPIYNYLYDTAYMFHSWYSELPKDLGFLNSFFIREAFYWKDLAETNDLEEYYKYNALDTWGTGNAFLAMILELPDWAIQNYLLEFPLIFPCHMSEMIGIERDMEALAVARKKQEEKVATLSASLDKILGVRGFNVMSPPQMKALLKIIGCADLKSADEKNLKRARFRHPLNARIIKLVLDIREARTLVSRYLQIGEKAKEFHRLSGEGNRILYSLNPEGTDSSRLASKEHHFWCGINVQQQPRGPEVKCTYKADPGFYIAEVDLEQAESRDTAYIAGEENLIDAVTNSPDFHSANASAFFGIPFEKLYDTVKKVRLNKPLIDIAKRVNHGANYNMGENVLVETMGEEKIAEARKLLGLSKWWSYKQVAAWLLERFHERYPGIKRVFYPGVVEEILSTRMLKHHICGINGNESTETWTRYCFGSPDKNKRHLNSYISHPPQSLNAQTLNKAFLRVFHEIAMNPEYSPHFKLLAQIHDSILFQYRAGHEYLCDMVKERMEIPVTIKGYDGKIRTFTVPAGVKKGKEGKPAKYWSETE